MYLHIGNGESIKSESVIGIFDLDTATVSKNTKKLISYHQKRGEVSYKDIDLPRSFVLCDGQERGSVRIKLSRLSTAALRDRAATFTARLGETEYGSVK